jgi:RNA polymerase-binding transcription factor DksA
LSLFGSGFARRTFSTARKILAKCLKLASIAEFLGCLSLVCCYFLNFNYNTYTEKLFITFMLDQEFIEEMKEELLASKSRLEQELAGLPEHVVMGDDLEANEDEVGPDEANADERAIIEADLKKIDKALAKIEDGSYGTDDDGHEISEARLRALPWADTAI